MLKRIVASIVLFSSFFLLSSSVSLANCGDLWTVGGCGSYGGCESASQVCVRLGNFRYECQDSPACENADHSQNRCGDLLTNDKCGPSNGCEEGYMCSNDQGRNPRCVTPTSDHASCATSVGGPSESESPSNGITCTAGDPLTANRCGSRGGCQNASDMCLNGVCTPSGLCANAEEPQLPAGGCGSNNTVGRCNSLGECPQGQKCTIGGPTGYQCIESSDCAPTSPSEPVDPSTPDSGGSTGGSGGGGTGGGTEEDDTPKVDIFDGPTESNFRQLNPLSQSEHADELSSPGGIVSRLLLFAFPLAGLILFAMIVWGGFEMLSSAASKGIEAGKQRVTAALVGFMLLFVAYWVFQIIEVIFGVVIL